MSSERELAPKRAPRWRLWLTVVMTLGLLVVVIEQFGGSRSFIDSLAQAELGWVLFAFALACASVVVTAQRWRQVLHGMGYRVGYGAAFHAVLAAWPLSVTTPSRAGDFARPFMLRETVPLSAAAGSVLAEKIIDIHMLLAVALVCASLYRRWELCAVAGLMLAAEYVVVLVLLRGRERLLRFRTFAKRGPQIEALYAAFDRLVSHPAALLAVSTSALVIRLLTVGVVHALLRSVGVDAGFLTLVAPWMLATLVGLVPLTMAGMGTRDAAFIVLLHASGGSTIPKPALLVATVGYSLLAVWSFALAGLPFLAKATLGNRAQR